MKIELKKFGTTLTSRHLGKEALAAFQPSLSSIGKNEKMEIDFNGVITFSPSWADEFLTPLFNKYKGRIKLKNTKNPSVKATLDLLERLS